MAAPISLTLICLVFIAGLSGAYGKADSNLPLSLLDRLLPVDAESITEILAHVRHGGTIPARLCKQAGLLCTQYEEFFGPSFKRYAGVKSESAEDFIDEAHGGDETPDPLRSWSIVHGRSGAKGGQTRVKAEDQLDVSKEQSFFFFRISALQGKTVSLPPSRSEAPSKFLAPDLVGAFQDMDLPQILHTVGLSRHSRLARASRRTWKTCHHKSEARGEIVSCVSSVDHMLDLVNSFLLTDSDLEVKSLTRSGPYPAPFETLTLVNHTVVSNNKLVTCHTLTFPFAMYVCHGIPWSIAFQVTVQDKAGQQMVVPAVCHMDTSSFNPSHVAFKVLNTTPGTGEVCHWLPENSHIVWYL